MDIEVAPGMKACSQMMKPAVHQHQYRLKQKYFNPFPLNLVKIISPIKSMVDDQWNAFVESWKNPKKMVHLLKTLLFASCIWTFDARDSEKNKANRDQVKFHQTTDSRSYPMPCDNLVSQTYGCGFPDVKFCFYVVIVYNVPLASANKCFI